MGRLGALHLYPTAPSSMPGLLSACTVSPGMRTANLPGNAAGYYGRAQITHNVSAVTGACLAVRRELFYEVQGLDEKNLPVAFNDVDFCLRLAEKGYTNVYAPYARLYHHEGKTRGSDNTPDKLRQLDAESYYCVNGMRKLYGIIRSTIQTCP